MSDESIAACARLLGVTPGASADEIRVAYRRAAKQAHPDSGGQAERFVRLQWARDVLLTASVHHLSQPSPPPAPPGATAEPTSAPRGADAARAHAVVSGHWNQLRPLWHRSGGGTDVLAVTETAVWIGVSATPGSWPTVCGVSAATGEELWHAAVGAPPVGPAAISGDVIIVATTDGRVHGLDRATGVTRWESQLPDTPTATATLIRHHPGRSETVPEALVVASGDTVRRVDADGTLRWVARPGVLSCRPVVAGDAVVVVTTAGQVVVIDGKRGRPRWWVRQPGAVSIAPVAVGDWLWLAEHDTSLVAVDLHSGAARQRVDPGGVVESLHPLADGLMVRLASQALIRLAATGRPLFKLHLDVPFGDPVETRVGGIPVVIVRLGDDSLRFIATNSGDELHHVTIDTTTHHPGGNPSGGGVGTLWFAGDDIVVVPLASGAVEAHRRIGFPPPDITASHPNGGTRGNPADGNPADGNPADGN